MYRDQRADVGALQQGSPLPQPAEPIHELHVCGRQLGADMATRRTHGSHLPAVYPGGESLDQKHFIIIYLENPL